ncbi:hypothetical protein M5X11_19870 [Paenibacillus alginolyticus]|uniref:Uncharacterized protein n=1 Tax=Paenibacillus alginolyticus TaxID=59839 RepID=A0ABT4GIL8_9BACL|nr:hypothetical protein [Paenibacillus alginolyticus]MCY9667165.1 hypothetical protein [Paenibacillus alginolyticus]MCY9696049.1 hypothetical protein [Paenibacillus alginolyticus]MEC0141775.1 hypothetical protein [Paenibacillus alginolyticus]
MGTDQTNQLEQIRKLHEKVSSTSINYWFKYSNINTWEFWIILGVFILPLIALYFLIDRKKAILIGFFGFNIHMWFHYADIFCVTNGFVTYPYKFIPLLPASVSLDTSLIPVTFLLLYQWTLNNHRNYYLYATAYSVFLSFLFKPALVTFGLFRLYKGMNYFYIFLIFLSVSFLSKWMTNLFLHIQQESQKEPTSEQKISIKKLFLKKVKAK